MEISTIVTITVTLDEARVITKMLGALAGDAILANEVADRVGFSEEECSAGIDIWRELNDIIA